jgi:hypothetical protein
MNLYSARDTLCILTPFASTARPSGRGYCGPFYHLTGAGTSNRHACQLHAIVIRRVHLASYREPSSPHVRSGSGQGGGELPRAASPRPDESHIADGCPTANPPGLGGAQKVGAARSPGAKYQYQRYRRVAGFERRCQRNGEPSRALPAAAAANNTATGRGSSRAAGKPFLFVVLVRITPWR